MRTQLAGISLQINEIPIGASTMIGAVGSNVLVLTSAIPARALTLTSSYLADSDGKLAVTRLVSDAHAEQFSHEQIAASDHRSTLAGACLLEHAAALRELLSQRTGSLVTLDVDPGALECAAEAWGPLPPPG